MIVHHRFIMDLVTNLLYLCIQSIISIQDYQFQWIWWTAKKKITILITSKMHLEPSLRGGSTSSRRKFKLMQLPKLVRVIGRPWISSANKIGFSFFKLYTLSTGTSANITKEDLTKTCYLMHALQLRWWVSRFQANYKNSNFSHCRGKTVYSCALIFWY